MSEKEKMLAGELYRAVDPELVAESKACRALLRQYNASTEDDDRWALLRLLLSFVGHDVKIQPPFLCDYGRYISIGHNTFINFGCVILDCNRVDIGADVQFGPCVQLLAAYHPVDAGERIKGPELSKPIRIEDNVWIGGGAIVLPGVTVGTNSTVGAGSVVTRDVPANVVVAGNPARLIRRLG